MMAEEYDRIVIGAGLYGLYAAVRCAKLGQRVLVIERDATSFSRATYINQARVHGGYHYPRSLSTALRTAEYFERFNEEFGFCILDEFEQIYATANHFSWTNASEFKRFCESARIRCDQIPVDRFFKPNTCDGAFATTEYTYDALLLRDYFLHEIASMPSVHIEFNTHATSIDRIPGSHWEIKTRKGETFLTSNIINATYASINNIHALVDATPLDVKYELCEIILCETSPQLEHVGITVMDGPFFSIMPFGKTGLHSLTSVTFTPHKTSLDVQPTFDCQKALGNDLCTPPSLSNCNDCPEKPESAWPYMSQLARSFLLDDYEFSFKKSLFSMKPILKSSEIDDSRPTIIRKPFDNPSMISVLSGKITTVYDLDAYLE